MSCTPLRKAASGPHRLSNECRSVNSMDRTRCLSTEGQGWPPGEDLSTEGRGWSPGEDKGFAAVHQTQLPSNLLRF